MEHGKHKSKGMKHEEMMPRGERKADSPPGNPPPRSKPKGGKTKKGKK